MFFERRGSIEGLQMGEGKKADNKKERGSTEETTALLVSDPRLPSVVLMRQQPSRVYKAVQFFKEHVAGSLAQHAAGVLIGEAIAVVAAALGSVVMNSFEEDCQRKYGYSSHFYTSKPEDMVLKAACGGAVFLGALAYPLLRCMRSSFDFGYIVGHGSGFTVMSLVLACFFVSVFLGAPPTVIGAAILSHGSLDAISQAATIGGIGGLLVAAIGFVGIATVFCTIHSCCIDEEDVFDPQECPCYSSCCDPCCAP